MRVLRLAVFSVLAGAALPLCASGRPLQHAVPPRAQDGWGYACSQNKQPFVADEKGLTSPVAACDEIGPLRLGMSRADAEKVLGDPTTEKSFGRRIFYIYSLQMDETAHMITYAVIGYDSQRRVGSIQLAGTPWPGAWTFADIKLGDPGKAVISRLGNPREVSLSRQEGTVIWDYLPSTFSFEIRGSVVSSIRVSE